MTNTLPYRHTQIGYTILAAIGGGALIMGLSTIFTKGSLLHLFLLFVFILSSALFGSLKVIVDETSVRLKFGIGTIRKTISLDDVQSCAKVRNNALCGWGIRYIGNGWMYNVSGLDAVDLTLKNERRFRIGTNDPDNLLSAIQSRLQ